MIDPPGVSAPPSVVVPGSVSLPSAPPGLAVAVPVTSATVSAVSTNSVAVSVDDDVAVAVETAVTSTTTIAAPAVAPEASAVAPTFVVFRDSTVRVPSAVTEEAPVSDAVAVLVTSAEAYAASVSESTLASGVSLAVTSTSTCAATVTSPEDEMVTSVSTVDASAVTVTVCVGVTDGATVAVEVRSIAPPCRVVPVRTMVAVASSAVPAWNSMSPSPAASRVSIVLPSTTMFAATIRRVTPGSSRLPRMRTVTPFADAMISKSSFGTTRVTDSIESIVLRTRIAWVVPSWLTSMMSSSVVVVTATWSGVPVTTSGSSPA